LPNVGTFEAKLGSETAMLHWSPSCPRRRVGKMFSDSSHTWRLLVATEDWRRILPNAESELPCGRSVVVRPIR